MAEVATTRMAEAVAKVVAVAETKTVVDIMALVKAEFVVKVWLRA